MTDHVSSDTAQGPAPLQVPADLIRDAVSAGLSAKAGAAPAEFPPSVPSEPVGEAPAPSAERAAGTLPPSARRRLAGIGGWAKTVPRRLHRVDIAQLRWPAAAMGMVLTAGLGFGAAHLASRDGAGEAAEQRWSEASAGLKQTHGEVARLAGELKSVRNALDGLKLDRARADLPTRQAQLNDKLERATSDGAARIGKLAEQLDRIEKTQRDPNRLASLVERLDRIEKQTAAAPERVAAAPTPPPKPVALAPLPSPADVTQTGSIADAKPAAKVVDRTADKVADRAHDKVAERAHDKVAERATEFDPRRIQLDTHILRDVDQGIALIEARNGRVFEAHAGQTISGLGRIEAVERRGRGWIVVTAKGFVGERLP